MMWKSTCTALALAAALVVAGCGEDNNCNCSNNPTQPTTTPGVGTPRPTATTVGVPTFTPSGVAPTGPTPTTGGTPTPGGCEGDSLTLTITSNPGSDLDTGWTGIAHNSVATSESSVSVDLNNCNSGTCTVDGSALVGQAFGGPLPLSSGGVPVCVLNTFREAITGTYECATGCGESAVHITSSVFLVQDIAKPCPTCVGDPTPNDGDKGGTCDGGKAPGAACDVNGVSEVFGSTSNDCLPTGSSVGELGIDLAPLTTGTVSVTADQTCVSVGSVGQCFCPSQNRPNACDDGICGANGTCSSPIDGLCSNQKFRSCTPGSGTQDCDAVFPGAGTCVDTPRPCFGPTITRTGQCGTVTGALVSFFCIPATRAPAINTTAGLPGPGALTLPGRQVRTVR
jgi:hypothetical protein